MHAALPVAARKRVTAVHMLQRTVSRRYGVNALTVRFFFFGIVKYVSESPIIRLPHWKESPVISVSLCPRLFLLQKENELKRNICMEFCQIFLKLY